MTDSELREYVERLSLRGGVDREAPEAFRAFAFYSEAPGCMAFGTDTSAAARELDNLIVPFLRLIVDIGGELPLPRVESASTAYFSFGPLFVGNPESFGLPSRPTLGSYLSGSPTLERRDLAVA